MAQREIKLSLVYRDMWQSSGKYQPRKDQLERIAPVLVEMGCFARVETNGGPSNRSTSSMGRTPTRPSAPSLSPSTLLASRRTCWTVVSTACVCSPSLLTYVA